MPAIERLPIGWRRSVLTAAARMVAWYGARSGGPYRSLFAETAPLPGFGGVPPQATSDHSLQRSQAATRLAS